MSRRSSATYEKWGSNIARLWRWIAIFGFQIRKEKIYAERQSIFAISSNREDFADELLYMKTRLELLFIIQKLCHVEEYAS